LIFTVVRKAIAQTGHPTVNGKQTGFTYIALLIAVAILGATLTAVGQVWHTLLQHDRENELLFIGNQFRLAFDSYYANNRRFPMRLEDLLLDDRNAGIKRYLRKIYVDPMTGHADWGLVTLDGGQLVGIHSVSEEKPLKRTGFRQSNASLEDKDKYSDWVFMTTIRGIVNPEQKPVPSTVPLLQPMPVTP